MKSHAHLGALAQFRRELDAGLRTANSPADALWSAAWRDVAVGYWKLCGNRARAAALSQDAARIIIEAARRKHTERVSA